MLLCRLEGLEDSIAISLWYRVRNCQGHFGACLTSSVIHCLHEAKIAQGPVISYVARTTYSLTQL